MAQPKCLSGPVYVEQCSRNITAIVRQFSIGIIFAKFSCFGAQKNNPIYKLWRFKETLKNQFFVFLPLLLPH